MMQAMRNNTTIIIWIAIAAFIGTIIFAWGADITSSSGQGGAPAGVVGEVNGREIPLQRFGQLADQYIENQRQQNPEKEFTETDYANARTQAWNEFVRTYIEEAQMEKLGLTLTDQELVDFIRRYPPQEVQQVPDFQTEGQFDFNKYQQAMGDPRFAEFWIQVESMMRPRLRTFKLQEYIGGMARVSEEELQNQYLRNNERVKVSYALVPFNKFDVQDVTIDSSTVKEYYQAHTEEFREERQAYYTLFRLPKEPSESDEQRALARIQQIKDEIDGGMDFAEAANQYTEDQTGQGNGGALGYFARGTMVQPFDSVVFAMEDGEISEPVKTRFGYHLIHRTGYRRVEDKEEVEASHILIKPELSATTLDELRGKMQAVAEAKSEEQMEEVAQQEGVTIDNQRKLTEGGSIASIGRDEELEKFLFTAEPGSTSEILDRGNSFLMLRAEGVQEERIAPLEEVYSIIERKLMEEKQREMALAEAQKIYDAIQQGQDFAAAAEATDTQVSESDYFARTGRIPRMGQDPAFIGTAFSLSDANKYSKPLLTNIGAAVIKFEDKLTASLDGFSAQKDTLKTQLLQQKQSQIWSRWFNEKYEEAEIKDYRDQLFGSGS